MGAEKLRVKIDQQFASIVTIVFSEKFTLKNSRRNKCSVYEAYQFVMNIGLLEVQKDGILSSSERLSKFTH